MNRGKRSFDKATAKAIQKEVRQAQRQGPTPEQLSAAVATMEKAAIPPHKKVGKKEAQVFAGSKKSLFMKKQRLHPKRKSSRRTTPGQVEDFGFATHTSNVEGVHWLKTVQKQTLLQAKTLMKKIFKRRSYR
jgi:hypothetical protein